MKSIDLNSHLGRFIWAEIEDLAADGLLSTEFIQVLDKFKLRNACEDFLYGDDPSAIELINVIGDLIEYCSDETDLLVLYFARVHSCPDDIEAWHHLCRIAEATMLFLDADPNAPSFDRHEKQFHVVARECHAYASAFINEDSVKAFGRVEEDLLESNAREIH